MWTPAPNYNYTFETLLANLIRKLSDNIRDPYIIDHAKVGMRTKLCLVALVHQLQFMTSPAKVGPMSSELWSAHLQDTGVLASELEFMFGWTLTTTNAILARDKPWLYRVELEGDALRRLGDFCGAAHDRQNTVKYAAPVRDAEVSRTRLVDSDTGQLVGVNIRVPRARPDRGLQNLCLDCDSFQRKVDQLTFLEGTPGQSAEVLAGILKRPANRSRPDFTLSLQTDGNWTRTEHDGLSRARDRSFRLEKGSWQEVRPGPPPEDKEKDPNKEKNVPEKAQEAGARTYASRPLGPPASIVILTGPRMELARPTILQPREDARPTETAPAAQPAAAETEQPTEPPKAPPPATQEANPGVVLEKVSPDPDVLIEALQEEDQPSDMNNVD